MASLHPYASSEEVGPSLSMDWHERLAELVGRGKKAAALEFIEQTIAQPLPLFGGGQPVFESRRLAWMTRTHLLMEWSRPTEALAWTCLECELGPPYGGTDADALRERLKRLMGVELNPAAGPELAKECHWPGVAGMHALRAVLEREVLSRLRAATGAPGGILLYGPPGCGRTFIAGKMAEQLGVAFHRIEPSGLAAHDAAPGVLYCRVDSKDAAEELLAQLDRRPARSLVVASATFPDLLDPALLAPGRLEQQYWVGLPDCAARLELFRQGLAGQRCRPTLDWAEMVARSVGHTVDGIFELCAKAIRYAADESQKIGHLILINSVHFSWATRDFPPTTMPGSHQLGARG